MNRRRGLVGLAFLALAVLAAAACAPTPVPIPAATPTLRALPPLAATPVPETMECLVVGSLPTPAATRESLFPAPQENDHSLGDPAAQVTFVVYTDYQSPAASALEMELRDLMQKYPQSVRVIQRSFPVPNSDKGMLAAVAVEAAARQGKYWEMSAVLFSNQAEWSGLEGPLFQAWLDTQVKELGMDSVQFNQDLRDPAIKTSLDQAQRFGLETGIPVIPFLVVNGEIYQGPRDARSMDSLVNLLRMEALQFTDCPPFSIDPAREYTAELETTRGRIVLQLFPQEAPLAVNSFVFLARQGWYDGVPFHRVIPDFVAQAGDPSGTGFGSPGYAFPDEISKLRFDRAGILAMANAGPDSNGSQFFITYRAAPELDGLHTIFGQVLEGMEVLTALTPRDPSQSQELAKADLILKIVINEK
jgi:cyclophilin family peptidyl-prolyl cis-trans isomerase/protein-disulfide isomerase